MSKRPVRDIMARSVLTLDRNDSLDKALDLMKGRGIRHILVVEKGSLVGILSQRDLFHATLGSVMRYGERAERSFLATLTVKEVMAGPPLATIEPDTSISEAARLMAEDKIGCLPVLDNDEVVGLVTKTDILREVAKTQAS